MYAANSEPPPQKQTHLKCLVNDRKKYTNYIIVKSLPNCEGRAGAEEKARLSGVLKTEDQRWVGGSFVHT